MNNEKLARDIGKYRCKCIVDIAHSEQIDAKIIGSYQDNHENLVIIFDKTTQQPRSALRGYSPSHVHPLLRTIEQIDDEEKVKVISLWCYEPKAFTSDDLDTLKNCLGDGYTIPYSVVDYIRSIGIDCDGLIEQGIAIQNELDNATP